MISIRVQADIQSAVKRFETIRKDQVPFAAALALTRTAQVAQGDVRKTLAERFTFRGSSLQWLRRGIAVQAATKQNLAAVVYDKDWYMATQEEGGERSADGSLMPVPIAPALRSMQFRPRLQDILSQPSTFEISLSDGTQAIVRREGQARYPLTILEVLKRNVTEHPRLGMAQTVEQSVSRNFAQEFVRAAQTAMRTAK